MIFARTGSGDRIAAWLSAQTTSHVTSARFAALRTEIVEIGFASIAFFARHAWLTGAFAFQITLQAA